MFSPIKSSIFALTVPLEGWKNGNICVQQLVSPIFGGQLSAPSCLMRNWGCFVLWLSDADAQEPFMLVEDETVELQQRLTQGWLHAEIAQGYVTSGGSTHSLGRIRPFALDRPSIGAGIS